MSTALAEFGDAKAASFCGSNEYAVMFPPNSSIGAQNPLVQRAAQLIMSTGFDAPMALTVAKASMSAGQNFTCVSVDSEFKAAQPIKQDGIEVGGPVASGRA